MDVKTRYKNNHLIGGRKPMERQEIIDRINRLYPADTNQEGKDLLWKAICNAWEDLPEEILSRYLAECIWKEQG